MVSRLPCFSCFSLIYQKIYFRNTRPEENYYVALESHGPMWASAPTKSAKIRKIMQKRD